MKTSRFLVLISVFLMVSGCRPAAAPVAVSEKPVSINERRTTNNPLPPTKPFVEMSWASMDDRVQKLGDLSGKVVILDFWATYCEPCKRAIPHLNSLLAKHGRENLQIVGLNVGGEEDRGKIPNFVASTKIDYDIAFPEEALTSFIFSERSDIPQTAIFDRRGRLFKKIVGFNDEIQKEIDSAVEQALAIPAR